MDKRFPASSKKLKKKREEGQIPRSQQFVSFFTLALGLITLYLLKENILKLFYSITLDLFNQDYLKGLGKTSIIVLPIFILANSIQLIICLFSGGFPPIVPSKFIDFEKLNPVNGIKKIFIEEGRYPFKPIVESILRSFLIILFGAYLTYCALFESLESSLYKLLATLFFWGFFENIITKLSFDKKMMMDLEELKKEIRESEGDPELKAHQRAFAREILLSDMREIVRKAKVVIVGRN